MPRYGSFETVREVSRSGRGAVYTARRAGGGEERFAVKIFELPAYMAEEGEIERESTLFLNAAEIQKQVAQAGSCWAAIHETGTMDGGAWYATDLFDRSIERFLLNRPELEPADLLRVVDSVLGGLFELRDVAGRAHGNLKTSNVLLSGKGDVSGAKVALSDPWASERLRGGEAREDLRAVGELIHWLVLHRGVRRPAGWPAPMSSEWKRLGKVGDGWLELANKLLDPTDEKLTLDEVPALVPGGKVRPGSSTTAVPTPIGRATKESRPEVKSQPPKSEPPKSQPPKQRSEPPMVESPATPPRERGDVERAPEAGQAGSGPPAAAPVAGPIATPELAPELAPVVTPAGRPPSAPPPDFGSDVTQDLPSSGGSGVAIGAGSGGGAIGSRAASGSASGAAALGGSGAVGSAASPGVSMSRPPSMASVGRVSTASVADAPKSFEELEAESRRRRAEPKKSSNAKWIGIGVGAVGLVAIAAVVIANMGGDKGDQKNRIALGDEKQKNGGETISPKPDPSKDTDPGTTGGSDPRNEKEAPKAEEKDKAEELRQAEEDRKRKEAEEVAARQKAAKEEEDRKNKEAEAKAETDRKNKEAADKEERDRKAKEAEETAAREAAARAEAERRAKEAERKDAADKAAAREQRVSSARGLIQQIAANLDAGLGSGEKPANGGESIEQLLRELDPAIEEEAVTGNAALSAALARARELPRIAAIGDADLAAARAVEEAGKGHVSEALLAGARAVSLFKDPKIGDLDGLEAGGKLLEGVRVAIQKLPDASAARRDAAATAADARRRVMFRAGVGGVALDDAAALRRAAAMAPDFGETPEVLPIKARVNLLVFDLRDELNNAGNDAAASAAMQRFRAGAGALGAQAAPLVAPMLAAIDAAAKEPEAGAPAALDLSKVGPGSVGWSLDGGHPPAADGSTVTFMSPSGQSVQFIRLPGNGAGSAVYLSAAEVSVGVFADAAKSKPEVLAEALKVKRTSAWGPFSWTTDARGFVARKANPVLPANVPVGSDPYGWLETNIALKNKNMALYPANLQGAIGFASDRHPMQHVTWPVADGAARAIGCRLPTSEEWTQAQGMPVAGDAPNLRDETWKQFRDYLIGAVQGGASKTQLPWPDQMVFLPEGMTEQQDAAAPAVAGNDGVLWFRAAPDPDGRFHDLVGNVAEWVQAPPSAAAGERYLIGGSALSPKEVEPTAVQRRRLSDSRQFSDVGFRLAFDAVGGAGPASEPLAARVKKAANALVLLK